MQANKVIESLGYLYEGAKKLSSDHLFLKCLQEEIDMFFKDSTVNEANAIFGVSEAGEVYFKSIDESTKDIKPTDFSVKVISETAVNIAPLKQFAIKEIPALLERYKGRKQNEIEENIADLTQELSRIALDEKKHKLLDKLLQEKK